MGENSAYTGLGPRDRKRPRSAVSGRAGRTALNTKNGPPQRNHRPIATRGREPKEARRMEEQPEDWWLMKSTGEKEGSQKVGLCKHLPEKGGEGGVIVVGRVREDGPQQKKQAMLSWS